MEGSRIIVKGTWKQSIIKENLVSSRIFSPDKEGPTKFEPVHHIQQRDSTRSLLKFRNNAHSQDQIKLQDSRYSQIQKDNEVEEQTPLTTPRSRNKFQSKNSLNSLGSMKKDSSHNSIQIRKIQSQAIPQSNAKFEKADTKIIKQLKQEFLQFKDRILREIRQKQIELNKIVAEIYRLIRQKRSSLTNIQNEDQVTPITLSSPSISFSKIQTFQYQTSQPALKIQDVSTKISQFEAGKPSSTVSQGQRNSETVIPKIKQSINKFMSLITQLKQDVSNDPFSKIESVVIESQS